MQFADWTPVYESHSGIPNVARFYEQAKAFREFLLTAAPDAEQLKDLADLKAQGILTDAEFEAQKAKILAS